MLHNAYVTRNTAQDGKWDDLRNGRDTFDTPDKKLIRERAVKKEVSQFIGSNRQSQPLAAVQRPKSAAIDTAALERDIAARIIQAHWRSWQAWKQSIRQRAGERLLAQLGGALSGMDPAKRDSQVVEVEEEEEWASDEECDQGMPEATFQFSAPPLTTPSATKDKREPVLKGRTSTLGGHTIYTVTPDPTPSPPTAPRHAVSIEAQSTSAAGLLSRMNGGVSVGAEEIDKLGSADLAMLMRAMDMKEAPTPPSAAPIQLNGARPVTASYYEKKDDIFLNPVTSAASPMIQSDPSSKIDLRSFDIQDPNASLTQAKLSSILNFLDNVEQEQDECDRDDEAQDDLSFGPPAAAHLSSSPAASMAFSEHSSHQPLHEGKAESYCPPPSAPLAPRPPSSSLGGAPRQFPAPSSLKSRRTTGGLSSSSVKQSQDYGAPPSAFLAESVYDGVKAKLRRLQEDVKARDATINSLHVELESIQDRHRSSSYETEGRHREALSMLRSEHEAGLARHLAFIDRLMADKDELARKCNSLADLVRSSEERQELAMSKMKEGWANELRRQKEGWVAAEKIKRDQWMESKTKEIKEATVKGLEGEVQKLLARHKAEVQSTQDAAYEDTKKQIDALSHQHEASIKILRDRMIKEQEDAVEKERQSGQQRLREASERYEQQLQTQRMRLVSDADIRLEQLEAGRRDEKKRHEDAIVRLSSEHEERERRAADEAKLDKEALRKAYEKQIESLKDTYETGQEGWRAAIAERARKEVSDREAAIRDKLSRERDEEIEAIVMRLEAENAAAIEEVKQEWRRREESTLAKHSQALKDAKRGEAKLAEKFRLAGTAADAAESRIESSERQIAHLQKELESRNEQIKWLESQVNVARNDAQMKAHDIRSVSQQKEEMQQQAVQVVLKEKEEIERKMGGLQCEMEDLSRRHANEMNHVEARVRSALSKKDESLKEAKDQVLALTRQLKATERILEEQRALVEEEEY